MGGLANQVAKMCKKIGYFFVEYFFVGFYWMQHKLKMQMKKISLAKTGKQLEKAYSGLGAAVYPLIKEGEPIQGNASVETQMKNVQQAEAKVVAVNEVIDGIKEEFARKRQELKEKYQEKKTQVDASSQASDTAEENG